MPVTKHNPKELFPQYRCYSHAIEIHGDSRLLVISGLNGYLSDGKTMPESFDDQAEIIWTHLQTILRSAAMDLRNLVSLRIYLADLTVVCCRLLDPRWKLELEIEAMAAT